MSIKIDITYIIYIGKTWPIKLLHNKSNEIAVLKFTYKTVANCSNIEISVAARLKTEMLDKTSASVLNMFHSVICTISP